MVVDDADDDVLLVVVAARVESTAAAADAVADLRAVRGAACVRGAPATSAACFRTKRRRSGFLLSSLSTLSLFAAVRLDCAFFCARRRRTVVLFFSFFFSSCDSIGSGDICLLRSDGGETVEVEEEEEEQQFVSVVMIFDEDDDAAGAGTWCDVGSAVVSCSAAVLALGAVPAVLSAALTPGATVT